MKEFSSVVLFGYKFTVPCYYEEILTANYGNKTEWSIPTNDIDWRNGVEIIELDLPFTIRLFFKNGIVLMLQLKSIKVYFAKINKTLPTDDEKFL